MASIMAKWGEKKWQITTKLLNPIDNLSYTMNFNAEEGKKEKRSMTIPYSVYKEFGINVDSEIDDWYKFLGESNSLYLGTKRFGPKKLKLTGVSVSDIKVSDIGTIISAAFSLSFEES